MSSGDEARPWVDGFCLTCERPLHDPAPMLEYGGGARRCLNYHLSPEDAERWQAEQDAAGAHQYEMENTDGR